MLRSRTMMAPRWHLDDSMSSAAPHSMLDQCVRAYVIVRDGDKIDHGVYDQRASPTVQLRISRQQAAPSLSIGGRLRDAACPQQKQPVDAHFAQRQRTEVDPDVANVHVRERHELTLVGRVRQNFLCAMPHTFVDSRTWRRNDEAYMCGEEGGGVAPCD